ncbi:polyprotein [Drepanopeziza brunnea f. sp. 'multigermtubi' MB_m1]|uniref:Polyprotein n=1 Tax=Marssonina brunnea f. sp. multigermtubi (strain MB_m1) TaxID=1072389 RepID=K1WUN1_MARBU|nr:polyprotein [Drepanopeziza brunnea f. sp. 'multigermtubi' MB_m1]EKD16127.1 polyprotein [Drepanopeziza brunnea f. sp. 'multigermtubi' MB_m1]
MGFPSDGICSETGFMKEQSYWINIISRLWNQSVLSTTFEDLRQRYLRAHGQWRGNPIYLVQITSMKLSTTSYELGLLAMELGYKMIDLSARAQLRVQASRYALLWHMQSLYEGTSAEVKGPTQDGENKDELRVVFSTISSRIWRVVCTDSYPLYEYLVRLRTTKEKRLMIHSMALRQSYERRELAEVWWIDGKDDPADATGMTKLNPNKSLTTFIDPNKVSVRVDGWMERA